MNSFLYTKVFFQHENSSQYRREKAAKNSWVFSGDTKVLRHLINQVRAFCENKEGTSGSLEPGEVCAGYQAGCTATQEDEDTST